MNLGNKEFLFSTQIFSYCLLLLNENVLRCMQINDYLRYILNKLIYDKKIMIPRYLSVYEQSYYFGLVIEILEL